MSINLDITAPCESVSFLHGLGNRPLSIGAYSFDMKRSKYYCQCGCGGIVSIFKGEPRKYISGHNPITEKIRKYHSDRMKGNKLFKGRTHSKETKKKMSEKQKGENNSVWKGGRTVAAGGYVTILKSEHPYADVNGRVKEERLVMEEHLGRYLTPEEIVHHINHNSLDNRIKNLVLMTSSNHSKYHSLRRWHGSKIDYREFSITR